MFSTFLSMQYDLTIKVFLFINNLIRSFELVHLVRHYRQFSQFGQQTVRRNFLSLQLYISILDVIAQLTDLLFVGIEQSVKIG